MNSGVLITLNDVEVSDDEYRYEYRMNRCDINMTCGVQCDLYVY